jgi:hypothetical protein
VSDREDDLMAVQRSEKCCPPMDHQPVCDTLDFRYQLPWRRGDAEVAVVLHFRLERCSGEVAVGDLAYSTTLMPGERVRLHTSDRHSRWSYDSASQLAYRNETTSEESYYTWGMAESMSDLTIAESGSSSAQREESWASGGASASVNFFGLIKIGGGGGGGSYDASSTSSFARNLSRHAESSSRHVAAGVRARSNTSVGEVERREHAEGESESHFESSTRTFQNPNRCHAITYLVYKLVKKQTVRLRLVAIERSVVDPGAPAVPDRRIRPDLTGQVMVRPSALPATSKDRLEVERMARMAALERDQLAVEFNTGGLEGTAGVRTAPLRTASALREPLDLKVRETVLHEVDRELVAAGMLDEATGQPTERIIAELSWERQEILPTPGLLIKGCLDECNTCEPALRRQIQLELEHQKLRNDLLRRQIELLDQSQEYRCCPEGRADGTDPEGGDAGDGSAGPPHGPPTPTPPGPPGRR